MEENWERISPLVHRFEREIACATLWKQKRLEKADLTIIAAFGGTGFGHLVLGSITVRAVGNAACLVLAVHGGTGRS